MFNQDLKRFRKSITLALGVGVILSASATLEISAQLMQEVKSRFGQSASSRIADWQTLIQTAKHLSEAEKLQKVNAFFNHHVEFVDDIDLWGTEDYWATPLEMLARGAGDCEDYSIAKYFTLIELGVAEEKMRITYVKALELNQAHMVLTYFDNPRAIPKVLDNLVPSIQIATHRRDLLPVYSFNGSGLWLAKSRGAGKRIGQPDRLNMWEQLKRRLERNQL